MTARLEVSEEWPDGTFGGVRLTPGQPSRVHISRPDPDAATHRAELLAALAAHRRKAARRA